MKLQFVAILRRLDRDCDYGTELDNQIGDEVLQECHSDYLRRKLLEAGEDLTIQRTLELAGTASVHARILRIIDPARFTLRAGANSLNMHNHENPWLCISNEGVIRLRCRLIL